MLAINDEENVYNSMFAFMAKSDDEEKDVDKVTLDDLKQILDTCSLKKLRKFGCYVDWFFVWINHWKEFFE